MSYNLNLNVSEILANEPPKEDVVLLAEGRYGAICTECVVKPGKANNGSMVAHQKWKILWPEMYKDKYVKAFFVIEHPDMSVAQRGRVSLAKAAQACGMPPNVEDITIDFIGKKCYLDIVIEGKTATYAFDSNKVKKFLPATQVPTAPMSGQQRAAQSYGPVPTPPVMPATPVNLQQIKDDDLDAIPF